MTRSNARELAVHLIYSRSFTGEEPETALESRLDQAYYAALSQENGTVQISEDVIISIVTVAVGETEGVAGFSARLGSDIAEILGRKSWGKGVKLTITEDDRLYIECNIVAVYGYAVVNVAKAVQENVTSAVESMTGMQVTEVNVNVCGITVEQK